MRKTACTKKNQIHHYYVKVATVNCHDVEGGAARAAYRIHRALRQYGVDSTMYVNRAKSRDWTVETPRFSWLFSAVYGIVAKQVVKSVKTNNLILHSPAILPSLWAKRVNQLDVDIVHLHWINSEMMSVADICKLQKPVIWTLHDMWAFCGAEHYTDDFRWKTGYTRNNRPDGEAGFDLNRWVWKRKHKYWKKPIHIVAPSNWLAKCVQQSALMRDWPVSVIHNPLDTESWKPVAQKTARELLQLPEDSALVLFGSIGGVQNPRKGFDLLEAALAQMGGKMEKIELVVFGQRAPKEKRTLGFPVHYMGHLYDDVSMRLLYSAADVLVVPSRHDISSNVGIESLACGTPVVAFQQGGLPDIVEHKQTGYLARAFEPKDLATGIQWVLQQKKKPVAPGSTTQRTANGGPLGKYQGKQNWLSKNARAAALKKFAYPVIAKQYLELYHRVVKC